MEVIGMIILASLISKSLSSASLAFFASLPFNCNFSASEISGTGGILSQEEI